MTFSERPLSYRAGRAAAWANISADDRRRLALLVRQVEDGLITEAALPADIRDLLARAAKASSS